MVFVAVPPDVRWWLRPTEKAAYEIQGAAPQLGVAQEKK